MFFHMDMNFHFHILNMTWCFYQILLICSCIIYVLLMYHLFQLYIYICYYLSIIHHLYLLIKFLSDYIFSMFLFVHKCSTSRHECTNIYCTFTTNSCICSKNVVSCDNYMVTCDNSAVCWIIYLKLCNKMVVICGKFHLVYWTEFSRHMDAKVVSHFPFVSWWSYQYTTPWSINV